MCVCVWMLWVCACVSVCMYITCRMFVSMSQVRLRRTISFSLYLAFILLAIRLRAMCVASNALIEWYSLHITVYPTRHRWNESLTLLIIHSAPNPTNFEFNACSLTSSFRYVCISSKMIVVVIFPFIVAVIHHAVHHNNSSKTNNVETTH